MRLRSLLATALLSLVTFSALATCDEPERSEFDFWLGEWTIHQRFPAGEEWIEQPAATSVTKILDGCALIERWSGLVQYPWAGMEKGEPMEGFSIRYYLPEEKVWRIQWMDSRNPFLSDGMYGTIDDGYGEFEPRNREGETQWTRIVFERKAGDHVYWHLDLTSDGGENWRTIWIMDMKRR